MTPSVPVVALPNNRSHVSADASTFRANSSWLLVIFKRYVFPAASALSSMTWLTLFLAVSMRDYIWDREGMDCAVDPPTPSAYVIVDPTSIPVGVTARVVTISSLFMTRNSFVATRS